jgi:enoyl-CoA hydratase/carnithine racemase
LTYCHALEQTGLVSEVVPASQDFMSRTLELANDIASSSPIATKLTTKTMRERQNKG